VKYTAYQTLLPYHLMVCNLPFVAILHTFVSFSADFGVASVAGLAAPFLFAQSSPSVSFLALKALNFWHSLRSI
jgi:hypothetical protein